MRRLGLLSYLLGLLMLWAHFAAVWWNMTTPGRENTFTQSVNLTLRSLVPGSVPDEQVHLAASLVALQTEFVRLLRDLAFPLEGPLSVNLPLSLSLIALGLLLSSHRISWLYRGVVASVSFLLLVFLLSLLGGYLLHLANVVRGEEMLRFASERSFLALVGGVFLLLVFLRRRHRAARDRVEARSRVAALLDPPLHEPL